jgi:hypothetical protein
VLPFYLLHEPVIVAAAWLIVRWQAPIAAKYPALVIVSFAATLGLYEALVRRFRVTRLLSGMKPRIKPATRHQAPPRTAEVDGSVGERVEITPASPSPTPSNATTTSSQRPGLTSTVTRPARGPPAPGRPGCSPRTGTGRLADRLGQAERQARQPGVNPQQRGRIRGAGHRHAVLRLRIIDAVPPAM